MDSSLSIYFVNCEALSLSCHTLLCIIPTKITVAMGLVQRKGSSKSIHLKCQQIILVDNIFSVIRLDSLFGLNLNYFSWFDVCVFPWFNSIDSNNENSIKTCTCWHHNYWDRFQKHERTNMCDENSHNLDILSPFNRSRYLGWQNEFATNKTHTLLSQITTQITLRHSHFDIPRSHTNTFIVINLCSVQWNLCAIRIKCLPFALVYPKNRWKIDFSMAYEVVNHDFL